MEYYRSIGYSEQSPSPSPSLSYLMGPQHRYRYLETKKHPGCQGSDRLYSSEEVRGTTRHKLHQKIDGMISCEV